MPRPGSSPPCAPTLGQAWVKYGSSVSHSQPLQIRSRHAEGVHLGVEEGADGVGRAVAEDGIDGGVLLVQPGPEIEEAGKDQAELRRLVGGGGPGIAGVHVILRQGPGLLGVVPPGPGDHGARVLRSLGARVQHPTLLRHIELAAQGSPEGLLEIAAGVLRRDRDV